MKIFINDVIFNLTSNKEDIEKEEFDQVLGQKSWVELKKVKGKNILYKGDKYKQVHLLVKLLLTKKTKGTKNITAFTKNQEKFEKGIKSHFKIVKAGGGIVVKENKILMIFRQGKWDLPKGKMDPGETFKETAVREIKEETGVKSRVIEIVVQTWHTYSRKRTKNLKRTKWYLMECLNDNKMKAEAKEKIEEVRWCTKEEVYKNLKNSYSSIKFVLDEYYEMIQK